MKAMKQNPIIYYLYFSWPCSNIRYVVSIKGVMDVIFCMVGYGDLIVALGKVCGLFVECSWVEV